MGRLVLRPWCRNAVAILVCPARPSRLIAVLRNVAMISIILSFLWLPYHPWWSLLIIAFDFVVIWALIFHGRDIVSD